MAAYRLPPSAVRPAGFWNDASSIVPTCCAAVWPGTATETMPSFEMLIEVALAGIVTAGWSA